MSPRLRQTLPVVVGVPLIMLLAAASPAIGAQPLPLDDVLAVLWHPDDSQASVIVWQFRMPRALLGIAVGVALGAAGAIAQAVTRNPLADPGLIGVNAGAAAAVAAAIAAGGASSYLGYVGWAIAGAGLAAAVVMTIGAASRLGDPRLRLILAGVALSALLGSLTSALTIADSSTLNRFRIWAVGNLAGRGLEVALSAAIGIAALVALVFLLVPGLTAIGLGDDVARALGVRVTATRWAAVGGFAALSGLATAAAGPIGFVGLIVPHLARMATGPSVGWNIGGSAALGGVLVLAADLIGRVILPAELAVSIVLACLGTPIFVLLVVRLRRRVAA